MPIDLSGGAKLKMKAKSSNKKIAKSLKKIIPSMPKKKMPKLSKGKKSKSLLKSAKGMVSSVVGKGKNAVSSVVGKSKNITKSVVNKGNSGIKSIMSSMTDEVAMQRGRLINRLLISSIMFSMFIYIYYNIFYKYLVHLENINCQCSIKGWKYWWLRVYFIYIIALTTSDFVNNMLQITYNTNLPYIYDFLLDCSNYNFARFNIFLNIVSVIIANMYLQELNNTNCKCAEHESKDLMNIFYIIPLLFYAVFGFLIILSLGTTIISYTAGGLTRLIF